MSSGVFLTGFLALLCHFSEGDPMEGWERTQGRARVVDTCTWGAGRA